MSDITFKSVSEIRQGLASKEFSSVEITKAYLDRIEQHKDLNAFVSLSAEDALADAKLADRKIASGEAYSLTGVPIALKDLMLSKNQKASACSNIISNFISPYDSTVVVKLKEAGAVIVGKTNMDEFAMGSSNENSAFGPVKNPWNKECVPGGSSGGSAAAVSARLVPLALGTDTGGSIRQPASLSGIVGIRPTYGRVSRFGIIAYASSLDQVGAFGNSVKDCAEVLEVISGHCLKDSTSMQLEVPEFSSSLDSAIQGLRVGVPKEYFIEGIDPEVKVSIQAALTKLESLGAELVEISLPHTEYALATYYIIAPAEASSNLARYDGVRYGKRAEKASDLLELYMQTRSEGFGDEVKRRIMIGTYVLSTGYYDAYYLHAQKVRRLVKRDFDLAFDEKCDLIACPTAPTTAFKIGEKVNDPLQMYLNDIFTIPVNLAGLPGMSVPCGLDSKGLPIGLQLIGKPFDESTLFRVGHHFEQATEWHKQLPPLS